MPTKKFNGPEKMIVNVVTQTYIRKGGNYCPNCGSGNISAGELTADGPSAHSRVQCLDCPATWTDVFKLVDMENLEIPSEPSTNTMNKFDLRKDGF